MDSTVELLLEQVKKQRLSHFYLITASHRLGQWGETLLVEFLRLFDQHSLDHPDILILKPSGSSYSHDDIKKLQNFVDLKIFELPLRFVLVPEAHLLSSKAINKLLKTLESPPPKTHFFFLNPTGKALLPTLSSRAVQLFLSPVDQNKVGLKDIVGEQYKLWEQFLKTKEKGPLLDQAKPEHLLPLAQYLIDRESKAPGDYKQKNNALRFYQEFQKNRTYNNSSKEALFILLNWMEQGP